MPIFIDRGARHFRICYRHRTLPFFAPVQVVRRGVGWAEKPWVPPIRLAAILQKRV